MRSDFSRTLALLRKERKVSQRIASGDLGVSQALLSHYENGLREPGLSFVARAADYYNVSCDFLLGRSLSRDGSAVSAEQMPDMSRQKDNVLRGSALAMLHKKLLVNSLALLMDQTGLAGSRQLTTQVSNFFALQVYRVFRMLYSCNDENNPKLFRDRAEWSEMLADAQSKRVLLRIRQAALGVDGYGIEADEVKKLNLSPEELTRSFPETAGSLLTLIQTASEQLEEGGPKKKK